MCSAWCLLSSDVAIDLLVLGGLQSFSPFFFSPCPIRVFRVNATTGAFSGNIRPYNEYFLVAYLAKLADPTGKGAAYYNRYFAARSNGPGGDPAYPVRKNYWGYSLLTDNNRTFMSSFIPQFCFFLSRGYTP